ncbi:MAG TPA: hypothetical protein VMV10_05160 [Pirellulales bacterium]|nr:hypothetical protein [Pirellulales bacterium]
MTTFAIPNSPPETTETALTDVPQDSFPAPDKSAAPPQPAGGPLRRNVSSAWRLVRQGHAFVMQPKIWLACVLCCFAVLLTVFVFLPPKEAEDSPRPAAKTPHVKKEAEPPAETATRIVAPPADISPAADARHFEVQSSAGFAGPLGQAPEGENQVEAAGGETGEQLRIASEAKLGPRSSRYDGQAPAVERGGAAIYDVAPLDRSDEGIPEGGSLR